MSFCRCFARGADVLERIETRWRPLSFVWAIFRMWFHVWLTHMTLEHIAGRPVGLLVTLFVSDGLAWIAEVPSVIGAALIGYGVSPEDEKPSDEPVTEP